MIVCVPGPTIRKARRATTVLLAVDVHRRAGRVGVDGDRHDRVVRVGRPDAATHEQRSERPRGDADRQAVLPQRCGKYDTVGGFAVSGSWFK